MRPYGPEFGHAEPGEIQNEPLEFPNAESGIEAYLRQYPDEKRRAEKIRSALYEFLQKEIENTQIFKSEKEGVRLPYTHIDTADLAYSLYKKITGKDASRPAEAHSIKKQEYVFGSALNTSEGNEFTYVEEAMHQCIKHLPQALKEIEAGRAPENVQIYTLGMPTNEYGEIPPGFAKRLAKAPSDELSEVYAELIEAELGKAAGRPASIELYGMSLGSNLAIRTGENLVERKVAAQDFEAKQSGVPHLQIRAEAPVSLGPSKHKRLQIPAGFMLDLVHEVRLPEIKRIERGKKRFGQQVDEILSKKGFGKKMSPEQKSIKRKALFDIVRALAKNLEPKPETKINAVYGRADATTLTPGMAGEAFAQEKVFHGSLGQNTISRTRPNVRNFAAKMPHLSPRFPANKLKRMRLLGEVLEKLDAPNP